MVAQSSSDIMLSVQEGGGAQRDWDRAGWGQLERKEQTKKEDERYKDQADLYGAMQVSAAGNWQTPWAASATYWCISF